MTAATDIFGHWLDLLVDLLDEPDLTGAEVADRLHLSRFHLDRVVSSVGGEPPAALRRRILLERSAYRLATGSATVLDVAVEAGYTSNEAFTRAFTRAYGVAPSRWRARPGQLRLAAVNDIHFQPPGTIRVPSRRSLTAMDLTRRMLDHHVWLTGRIIECAAGLTDDQLDQRIELSLDDDPDPSTLRRLMSRLVGQLGMWNAALADRDYDWAIEEHESLSSLRQRLAIEGPAYVANIDSAIADDRLDDTFVDALRDPVETFTYGGMIAHVLTFAAHRRTLAVLALAGHGVTELGWGDPIRWVEQQ